MQLKKLTSRDINPCGYNVLIELLEVEETYGDSKIVLSTAEVNKEQSAMPIGKVLKFGPMCFKNHDSGCNSPEQWGITKGDYCQFPTHAYQRVAGKKSTLVYILDHDIKAKVNIK